MDQFIGVSFLMGFIVLTVAVHHRCRQQRFEESGRIDRGALWLVGASGVVVALILFAILMTEVQSFTAGALK